MAQLPRGGDLFSGPFLKPRRMGVAIAIYFPDGVYSPRSLTVHP